jgi:hypothetical protein
LPKKSCGTWQPLQVALAWWEPFSQPSYCSRMMWQLMQASGASLT